MMRTVTILGFDNAFGTAITGVVDCFSLAGVTWNTIHGQVAQPRFKVQIASLDGGLIRCTNGLTLMSHCTLEQVNSTDLLLIPTIGDHIQQTLQHCRPVLPWIRHHYEQGSDIASNCTGAYLLAETGILDGKVATTHWGFTGRFKRDYPNVELKPEQLITVDGNLFCAGGGMAWLDMAVFLIERYCGHEVARATAKSLVVDMVRHNQTAYSAIVGKRYHQDAEILAIQDWLESHFHETINFDQLADQFHLTPRTFKRRFKTATGGGPMIYLQTLRVEQAKQLLETTKDNLETIVQQVGYEDISSFSRLFKRNTGMTPGGYRAKFGRQ